MICRTCRLDLPPECFSERSDGRGKRRTTCKPCSAAAQKVRRDRGGDERVHFVDREEWWKMRRPWPWPKGAKVFEDVRRQR